MSTIVVAAILIICIVLISLIFVILHKNNKRTQEEARINRFSEAGSVNGLTFSSQLVLRRNIIGLDGLKRMLLIFGSENSNHTVCINMAEVKNCTIIRKPDTVNVGTERRPGIKEHLRSINIRFDFKNNAEPVTLCFYNSSVNSAYEMPELDAKAQSWQSILSKMIEKEDQLRA